jgi:hypothetical protein
MKIMCLVSDNLSIKLIPAKIEAFRNLAFHQKSSSKLLSKLELRPKPDHFKKVILVLNLAFSLLLFNI